MDSNFDWSEGGLQLLSIFRILIDKHGGEEKLADSIEAEIIKTDQHTKRPSNKKPDSVYVFRKWSKKELHEAIDMWGKGYSYGTIEQ